MSAFAVSSFGRPMELVPNSAERFGPKNESNNVWSRASQLEELLGIAQWMETFLYLVHGHN